MIPSTMSSWMQFMVDWQMHASGIIGPMTQMCTSFASVSTASKVLSNHSNIDF